MTMTERDAAYKAGQRAWREGKSRKDNPYSLASEEADYFNCIDGFNHELDKHI